MVSNTVFISSKIIFLSINLNYYYALHTLVLCESMVSIYIFFLNNTFVHIHTYTNNKYTCKTLRHLHIFSNITCKMPCIKYRCIGCYKTHKFTE